MNDWLLFSAADSPYLAVFMCGALWQRTLEESIFLNNLNNLHECVVSPPDVQWLQ